jgi:hypothetical protein
MKRILKYSFLALLSFVFLISCEKEETVNFGGNPESGWVQYYNPNTEINELYVKGKVISIPVWFNVPVNKEGTLVNYTVTPVLGNPAGIIEYSGSVLVPAGVVNGVAIDLKMIAETFNSTLRFDVTLTGSNKSEITAGIQGSNFPITKRVNICSNAAATSYVGSSQANITPTAPPAFTPWTPIMTPVAGVPRSWTLNTCWGLTFINFLTGNATISRPYPGTLTINPNNTVTVVGINDPAFPNRYPGGTGTFDPCTKKITYTLNQGVFTSPFTVTVTLTAN